jgi:hypothetical protein
VVDVDAARALRALCAERGIAVVADEVFADFALRGRGTSLLHGASGADAPLTFVLSGVSKALALPQLKLAWIAIAGAQALREDALARLEVIADTYLSVNGPGQLLLPRLLAGAAPVQAELRERLARNRAVLDEILAARPGLSRLPSDGGWSAIVQIRRGGSPTQARVYAADRAEVDDEEALVVELLDRHGVLAHPGFFFDLAREATGADAHLVVSLLPEPGRFREAAALLAAGCAEALAQERAVGASAVRPAADGGRAGA